MDSNYFNFKLLYFIDFAIINATLSYLCFGNKSFLIKIIPYIYFPLRLVLFDKVIVKYIKRES